MPANVVDVVRLGAVRHRQKTLVIDSYGSVQVTRRGVD